MNEYFIGIVTEHLSDSIIFESNQIGYQLKGVGLQQLPLNEILKLYVYLYQKPTSTEYFAFLSAEVKHYFCELITISQIGPKTALRLLNSMSLSDLNHAITSQNPQILESCRGITKKIAQAIIYHFQQKQIIYNDDPAYQEKWTIVFATLSRLGFNKTIINQCLIKVDWALTVEEIIKFSIKNLQDAYY